MGEGWTGWDPHRMVKEGYGAEWKGPARNGLARNGRDRIPQGIG